jgi:hypothetical protein
MPPQNFWQFLLICFQWIEGKFTRALGVAGGILGILAASNVIPVKWTPYCMLGVSILTYVRGQIISDRVDTANAIIANQGSAPPSTPAAPAKSSP